MGRKIDADDLVGTPEIAERFGLVGYRAIHDWLRRYDDFPAPVAVVAGIRVWNWPDVEQWGRETGRFS